MQFVTEISDLRKVLSAWRRAEDVIAFVPTMGNIHKGHLSLIDEAQKRADRIVSSIFVNPMQFDRPDDFGRYPRTLEEDRNQLQDAGVDLLFCPSAEAIYPRGDKNSSFVDVPGITDILCGTHRPGHFKGMATVVCKLFNLVQPELAVFGEKDYQQLLIVRRMVEDLNLPVEIVGAATAREASGLAMSSRNNYLSDDEREQAALIFRLLVETAKSIASGSRDYQGLEEKARQTLTDEGFVPDYYSILTMGNLSQPTELDEPANLVILVAAQFGKARLIDNLPILQHLDFTRVQPSKVS